MAYQTIAEYNVTGVQDILAYTATVVPSFIPVMLITLFLIALLTSYFSSKRLTGSGHFMGSFTAASYFTMIVAFVLSLMENIINMETLLICIAASVASTILLLTSGRENL